MARAKRGQLPARNARISRSATLAYPMFELGKQFWDASIDTLEIFLLP